MSRISRQLGILGVIGAGVLSAAGGRAQTSAWQVYATPPETTLTAFSYQNGLFLAAGAASTLYSSADGVTWQKGVSGLLPVQADQGGSTIVRGGYATSPPGGAEGGGYVTGFAYGNGVYVASADYTQYYILNGGQGTDLTVSQSSALSSGDAQNWTSRVFAQLFNDVTYGNGVFVAVGATQPTDHLGGDAVLYTSADGVNWTQVTLNPQGRTSYPSLYKVFFANNLFVAVGTYVFTSPDGINWTERLPAQNDALPCVAYGAGIWFGGNMYSTDGINWQSLPSYTFAGIVHVAYGAGLFVGLDDSGNIYVSSDGLHWNASPSPSNGVNTQVLFANGSFYVVGNKILRAGAPGQDVVLLAGPANASANSGDTVSFSATAQTTGAATYQWSFNGQPIPDATGAVYTLTNAEPANVGTYSVTITGSVSTVTASAQLTSVTLDRLADLSTRGIVGTGSTTLIGGFVLSGPGVKPVLVRAVGPGLASFGLNDYAPNLTLTVYQGGKVVATNSGWDQTNGPAITAAEKQWGAFPLQAGSGDAALLLSLPAGAYTATVSGQSTGVALVEIYNADPLVPDANARRLVNISTRGFAGTGSQTLIGGLVVGGNSPKTFLIRAVGPGLIPFVVPGVLPDPSIQLVSNGTVIASNTGVVNSPDAALITRDSAQLGAFPLSPVGNDSALVIKLTPGSYTVLVTGASGDTGVALMEIYELGDYQ